MRLSAPESRNWLLALPCKRLSFTITNLKDFVNRVAVWLKETNHKSRIFQLLEAGLTRWE